MEDSSNHYVYRLKKYRIEQNRSIVILWSPRDLYIVYLSRI